MYKTREEVENWLNLMKIKNYVINEDLKVDVNDNVDLSYKKLIEIPIRFGKVNGHFSCNNNNLISLEGCPREVNGSFNCHENKLINLKGCPEIIDGSLNCYNNSLTSLEYCPEIINGYFSCYDNKLTSLEHFPKEIKGDFIFMHKNKIKEEELLNFNFNIENVKIIYSDFNNITEKKEIFLERVNYYKNIKRENELLKDLSINSNNMKLNKKL